MVAAMEITVVITVAVVTTEGNMAKNINESILSKITSWAQNMTKTGQGNKKQAKALGDFLASPEMQAKMQEVAIEQLVQSFAQALSTIKDSSAKQNAVNQFWITWKDKTNQTLLMTMMKKYKFVPSKK
jgi:hypothetical protein